MSVHDSLTGSMNTLRELSGRVSRLESMLTHRRGYYCDYPQCRKYGEVQCWREAGDTHVPICLNCYKLMACEVAP